MDIGGDRLHGLAWEHPHHNAAVPHAHRHRPAHPLELRMLVEPGVGIEPEIKVYRPEAPGVTRYAIQPAIEARDEHAIVAPNIDHAAPLERHEDGINGIL